MTDDSARLVERRRRRRRRVKIALAVLGVVLVGSFLALHRKPRWYHPATITNEDIPQVEASVANVIDAIGDSMVLRKPFDVALSEEQVNEWLAGMPVLATKWDYEWNQSVHAAAVRFDEGFMRVGVHCERGNWQAILGLQIVPRVSDDGTQLIFQASNVTIGAIPLPARWWEPAVDRELAKLARKWRADRGSSDIVTDTSTEGVRALSIPNRFLWPNGERWFRIGSIKSEAGGTIRIGIVPL